MRRDRLPSRGEIWDVDWSPGRGSEQVGRRPALVVQNDHGNHSLRYPNTIVVAVSRQGRPIPFHVRIDAGPDSGLAADSWAKCEQVLTVAKDRLGAAPRGRVSLETMRRVDQALLLSLGIDPSAALEEG